MYRILTIVLDPDYLKFLEVLKQEVVTLPSAEVQLDKRLAEEKEKNGTQLHHDYHSISCYHIVC